MSTVPPSVPPPGGGSYTPPPPPPPPPAGGAPSGGSPDRTLMVILSYAWLLSLIPFLTKKDDPDIQWHAKNGLVMAIAYTVIELIFWGIGHYFPLVACLTFFIPCLIFLAYVAAQIFGIIKAVNGQRLRIPVLTEMAEKM